MSFPTVHLGRYVHAADADPPGCGLKLPAKHLEGRGLPCTVDTQEPEDLTVGEGERQATHSMNRCSMTLPEVVDPDNLRAWTEVCHKPGLVELPTVELQREELQHPGEEHEDAGDAQNALA